MKNNKEISLGKVALRTFVFLLSICVLSLTIFLIAFPKMSSNLFLNLGMNGLSARYAKVTYDRSGDINDLGKTFDRGVTASMWDIVGTYGEKLVEDEHFEEYADFRSNQNIIKDYKSYVLGEIAIAKYHNSDLKNAIEYVKIPTKNDYQNMNSATYLIYYLIDNGNKLSDSDIELVNIYFENEYEILMNNNVEVDALCIDAFAFNQKFGSESQQNLWENRYKK